ncbi:7389_t:CDS:2 [Paraglomus brasilianum]|uniref:7389_t:CDS:1 n=1 Tax=Paraglomus brasilianum TaxID=144538 RepID=A0A9N9GG02_9GLOM|nr:7389_t:CDS:2 [Paraglomus brasilianum]
MKLEITETTTETSNSGTTNKVETTITKAIVATETQAVEESKTATREVRTEGGASKKSIMSQFISSVTTSISGKPKKSF